MKLGDNRNDFDEISKNIARSFLHTVVVIDDNAFFGETERIVGTPKPNAKKPGRSVAQSISSTSKNVGISQTEDKESSDNTSSSLNAKILVDTFADKGLVCAVLKPQAHEEGLEDRTDHATQRADIVVLDWQIEQGDQGEKSIELLRKIIDTDKPDRLRLVAIYTSVPDLEEIVTKLRETLELHENGSEKKVSFEIEKGPLKIVVYKKAGGTVKIREASEKDLPEKLIVDFAKMTTGLLSNVAVKSLGEIRNNTHRVLSKFHPNLDAPFVTHRILSNPPEEAERHPIPILTSEITDILDGCGEIKGLVSTKMIECWLNSEIEKGLSFADSFNGLGHDEVAELTRILIRNGVENESSYKTGKQSWDKKIKNFSKSKKDKESFITSLLKVDGASHKISDLEFSVLTNVRSKYELPHPILTLGNILFDENEAQFIFCLTPLCDSVRLKEGRKFMFVPLEVIGEDNQDPIYNIVVRFKDDFVRLRVKISSYSTQMIEFCPDESGEVTAINKGEFWKFNSFDKREFIWVAELKFPHAQRIITQYSENLGRVGLTESDWLRRMSGSR